MNFVLERTVPPDGEPVLLSEMKIHLREFLTVTDNDSQISGLISAAREWAEDYTGRALLTQTWRLSLAGGWGGTVGGDVVSGFQGYPGYALSGMGAGGYGRYEWIGVLRRGEIQLHKAPVISLTSFAAVDAAGVETAIDPLTYELREKDSKWPRIAPLNGSIWPTGHLLGGLRITFQAGYSDEDTIPIRFKQAIKLYAEALYDRDPTMMQKLIDAATVLLKPERSELQVA